MLQENNFKSNDLIKSDWQYEIYHTDSKSFVIGEEVFLKSNPEVVMTIHSLKDNMIMCYWYDKTGEIQVSNFHTQCVLQYKYKNLLVYKDKFHICLN